MMNTTFLNPALMASYIEYSMIVSPEGPKAFYLFHTSVPEAIPAARIKRVGCIIVILNSGTNV